MRTPADLSKIVNQSGFPLQIALDRFISDHPGPGGWQVLYREHGWRHSSSGQEGFADLVLQGQNDSLVVVLEAKRVMEADWIFLQQSQSSFDINWARVWVNRTGIAGDREHSGYFDLHVDPSSYESMFCTMPGQDKSRPMLERLAADVLASTEAIATEERAVMLQQRPRIRIYLPVIVTTARLTTALIDPAKIELSSGEASDIEHKEIGWIRFRKQFSSDFAVQPDAANDFAAHSAAKEKSVFVVNVMYLFDFLDSLNIVQTSAFRSLVR